MQTLTQLIADVLTGLDLSWQTDAGELREGDFSPPEAPRETTFAFVTRCLNSAAADLCRGPFFVYQTGATGATGVAAGAQSVPYSALTVTDGSTLWSAETVIWTPAGGTATPLRFIGRERAELHFGGSGTGTKPVQYWSRSGAQGIRLWDTPAVAGGLSVRGPATPPPLAVPADTAAWLPVDLHDLLVVGARVRLAKKAKPLWDRLPVWQQRWDAGVAELFAQQRAGDPDILAFHLDALPAPPPAQKGRR